MAHASRRQSDRGSPRKSISLASKPRLADHVNRSTLGSLHNARKKNKSKYFLLSENLFTVNCQNTRENVATRTFSVKCILFIRPIVDANYLAVAS